MSRSRLAAVALAALVLAGTLPARAEGPTTSMSVWRIHGHEAEVRAWVPVALARRFGATGEGDAPASAESFARAGLLTGDYLARHLVLATAAGTCEAVGGGPQRGVVDGEWIVHTWRVRCTGGAGWRLRDDAFFEDAPTHTHFARVWREDVGEPIEKVLTTVERELAIGARGVGVSGAPAAAERARRVAPLALVLALAVAASGWGGGSAAPRALGAVAGLALGAAWPVPSGASVGVTAVALLAVVVTPLAREGTARRLGGALIAGCAGIVAHRLSAGALPLVLGVVAVAASASLARSRFGAVELAAGVLVSATAFAGEGALRGVERALAAAIVAAPVVVLAGVAALAARRTPPPRWLTSGLAAGVVAVTLAWIGLATR